jgi:peptidoglycan/LPS O-acetylase OafA/YrhL
MHDKLTVGPATERNVAVGYLRAFVTLLVIAHHAALAYHPYAPPAPTSLGSQPMLWQAFPVVDSQRWMGLDVFVGFNDVFFMSLMFLVSGLFVWPSLQRKGPGQFLSARLWRLGLPFVLAAGLLAPLAYFPSYLQTGAGVSVSGFWSVWLSLPHWPSGPAWFLWVLLAFDAIAAALTRLVPEWGNALGRLFGRFERPAGVFWFLVMISAVGYVPLAIGLDPGSWASFGPFSFQVSRPLHYAVYFFAGAGLGAYGLGRGLLSGDKLRRRWVVWVLAAVGAFLATVVCFLIALSQGAAAGKGIWAVVDVSFVVSCAASSFAFLALFTRFASGGRVGDSLAANAYGMYITHYPFVSWLQFALLGAALPPAAKATTVFVGAVVLSWALTAALRRIPAVGAVISSAQPPRSRRPLADVAQSLS